MKKGYIYAIQSAIFFGTAGVLVKLAEKSGFDSIELLIFQYTIAIIILFTFIFIKDKSKLVVSKKQLFHLCILGIVGNTFMTVFYYKAFEYLDVSMVTILLFTYPIMVFVYSIIFEQQKLNLGKLFAMVIAFIGCLLALNVFSGNKNYSFLGIIFGILSAIFYAFMNLYCEKKLSDVDSLSINAYSTLFSYISLIIFSGPKVFLEAHLNQDTFIYIVALAIFCEIIPLTLLYKAIQYIGSVKVSIIGNLEIPTAMAFSALFLKESISIFQLIGAILIVGAVNFVRKA